MSGLSIGHSNASAVGGDVVGGRFCVRNVLMNYTLNEESRKVKSETGQSQGSRSVPVTYRVKHQILSRWRKGYE